MTYKHLSSQTKINNEEIIALLSSYFSQRGSFLAQVIGADLQSLLSQQGIKPCLLQQKDQVSEKIQSHHASPTDTKPNGSVSSNGSDAQTSSIINHQPKPLTSSAGESLPSTQRHLHLETELIQLVAQKTGFPDDTISLDAKLLDDLNLDSIKGGELVAEFAKKNGLAGIVDPTHLGNASLNEIVQAVQAVLPQTEPIMTEQSPTLRKSEVASSKEEEVTELLLQLIEKQTGFPKETLSLNLRLLDDLNLDSIKAAELIATAAKQAGIAGKLDPSTLANATLGEIVTALKQAPPIAEPEKVNLKPQKEPITNAPSQPIKVGWVRNFSLTYVPQPESPRYTVNWSQAQVAIIGDSLDFPLSKSLQQQLQEQGAKADILTYEVSSHLSQSYDYYIGILPASETETEDFPLAAMVTRLNNIATLGYHNAQATIAYVQFGGGHFGLNQLAIHPESVTAAAFARSVHLESPNRRIRVIDLDSTLTHAQSSSLILQELGDEAIFRTVGYDAQQTRLVPQSVLQEPINYQNRGITWTKEDVILVTGGAKGITAECVLDLAEKTGVKMALVGSSPHPQPDQKEGEIAQTLARFAEAGLDYRYYACDITNQDAVNELIQEITSDLGIITGFIHGAGLNKPRRVEQVTLEEAIAEVSPKLLGAAHILKALATTPPKLILGFSSIIGVTGMPGNAWYGFANEALSQLLRYFHNNHPETQTLALAYSVWDEVGMGARLGSVKHLERMGISAIPPKEGKERFWQLFNQDPSVSEVIVTARLGGLDTWHPQPQPSAKNLRFIENVVYIEPNVSLTVRPHLTLERDLYVKDHIWRGSALFPTVFGLEAMAQAAAYVTGELQPEIIRIENISLRRPVVVNPTFGVTIQIQAEVLETNQEGERKIKLGIGTEQTGFDTEHFSAIFVLGKRKVGETRTINTKDLLAINPKVDLYGGLLFQGEIFQQLDGVFSLSREESLLKSHVCSSKELKEVGFPENQGTQLILGDPYFRDVLLQSMQLNIPQDICLPVEIGQIEFFETPTLAKGERYISAILHEKKDREYICEVIATNLQGQVTERLQGYRLRILEEHPENPTAIELAYPIPRDERKLQQVLQEAAQGLEVAMPNVTLAYLPNLGRKTKKERLSLERSLVECALKAHLGQNKVNFKLQTLPSGQPKITGEDINGQELSLSHDSHYCLCVLGKTLQGCDIETISLRPKEDWVALLGETRQHLLEELVSKGDTLEQAGTRIWSAIEAVQKAENGTSPQLSVLKHQGQFILLQTNTETQSFLILTVPVKLTRGMERMVAMVVQLNEVNLSPTSVADTVQSIILPNSHRVQITYDGPQGQPVYEHRFQVSFKESCSISRKVSVSQYISWVGKIRELPMRSMASYMVSDFVSGEWGMVTNAVSLRIVGEATSYDTIQARCWLGNVVNSSFDTYIEFSKVLPDETLERVAIAEVKATWVRLISYGIPTPEAFPEYLQSYLDHFAAKKPASIDLYGTPTAGLPSRTQALDSLEKGQVIYEVSPHVHHYGCLLTSATFQTTLEESNFVGNVYYGNYFNWQGRMLDLFLYSFAPEYLRVSTPKGEIIPVYSRMDYLREAMPFDKVRVYLYVKFVTECGASFTFEFYRELTDGTQEKLQIGQQEVIWCERTPEGQPVAKPWPKIILNALSNQDKPTSSDFLIVHQT